LYVGNHHGNGGVSCVAQTLPSQGNGRAGCLQNTVTYIQKKSEKIQIKFIWLLRTSRRPGIFKLGEDGMPGGLCHQAPIPDFERFGWWLPKLATVTVTKGLVALLKAVWGVTVWRLVAYIQVLTVSDYWDRQTKAI
jgi:hypothetical protein